MKKLIQIITILASLTLTLQAKMSKEESYKLINACKFEVNENEGKFDTLLSAYILGLSRAYYTSLGYSKIDNDFASLEPQQFAVRMCAIALQYRASQNKKTGGKYDVQNFQFDLEEAGYWMSNYRDKPDQNHKK